jgi:hypothetical protein
MFDSVIRLGIEHIYAERGIVDGHPESLFVDKNGVLVEKDLPTLHDFFEELVRTQVTEDDQEKRGARKIVLLAIEKYVKEAYYCEENALFFTREEFESLPINKSGQRIYRDEQGAGYTVKIVHGTCPYFDGQSTLRYSTDIPWVNIDCSQQDESSKKVSISVGENYINERIIKKNSDNRDSKKDKVIVIFDEAHMVFNIEPSRVLLAEIVRTARKRNVCLFICSQTLREFDDFPETSAIRKNAAALFVFKQDYSDRDYLIKTLGLTPAQVDGILAQGGDLDKVVAADDEEATRREVEKHRGEMTIVINRTAIALKVDYRKRTERYAVETAASEIMKLKKETA